MIMLAFIYMDSAELWGTWNKRNIQNENICLRHESNQLFIAFKTDAFNHLAIEAVVLLRLKSGTQINMRKYSHV